ncbi:hypothetical protein DWX41_02850 [Hungatella hathewayi]|uniref:Uncharacterized protein n=1 Tax=Hungatella hathewayi TaxID=154046 RepID=A0A3E2X1S2_9FIRM|nr:MULTISPECIES: hypothetical protein [Clostridia]RGC35140.1 hypothetical protein DWX41_02850 [Hungatella hathewayi]GKH35115.1 hypothetical protein CE91St64_45220 [Faecalicatena contorta]
MKCPKCGNELRAAKNKEGYYVCDACDSYYKKRSNDACEKPKEKKINVCVLISLIFGVLYLIYCAFYWSGTISDTVGTAQKVGVAIATTLVIPHIAMTALAVVFNALGLFMNKWGFVLTGAILYAVALILFPIYFIFVIVEMILSFVGFAQMKKDK